jgi:hypothetical protein
MIDQRALPTLQDAVDALHARLTSGRARATGNAVKTGLTGRVTDLTPDELGILEAVMGGRWSATMSEIWSRNALDAAGASEDDWALEKEIAYWAIRRGLEDDELALTVERIMRAGPYRSKWDEPRGAVSWLTQDVANAVKTTQERLQKAEASGPSFTWNEDDEATSEQPATEETPAQTIARLQRENRRLRATNAVQQTIIVSERTERLAAVETVRRIGDVLAIPSERLAPAAKILTIVTLMEAHSRTSRGQGKLPLIVLSERSGIPTNTVSNYIQDLAARDGSPIDRRVTRDWVTDDYGEQRPITVSLVAPRFDTVNESLAAVLTMGGPSDKAQQKKEQAKARAAASLKARLAARGDGFGWCEDHDNDLVAVKGYCPDCGEVVGERTVSVEEFRILNPEIQDSGSTAPTVDVRTKRPAFRDSEGTRPAPLPAEILNRALRDSAPSPVDLLDYAASRSQEPPPRCPAPGCGALGFRELPDGSYRCLKSGHDPRAYELVPLAVRGASE